MSKEQYFQNKHNGRVIKIIDVEVTDSGTILYTIQEYGTRSIDYTTKYALTQHWDEIENPDDACEAHSQTINTSDGEE